MKILTSIGMKLKQAWKNLKNSWKGWIFSIIFIAGIAFIIIFPTHSAHNLFVQYLSTFLNWPFIILILGLVLFFKYKDPIAERIRTLFIKTPKGLLLGMQPPQTTEKLKEIEKKLEEEKRTKEGFIEIYIFEKIIRKMYRSQYRLLKSLRETGYQLYDRTILYYSEYISRGGDKNYSISHYIDFLINYTGFIETSMKDNNSIMKLTSRGQKFVGYCNYMGYSENEFIPL